MGGFITSLVPYKWVIIGIAFAATAALSFFAGYSRATSAVEDKLVAAQMEMYAKGVAAQAAFDASQRKLAAADFQKRDAANKKRVMTLQEALAAAQQIIPQKPECTIPADAMRKLNEVAR